MRADAHAYRHIFMTLGLIATSLASGVGIRTAHAWECGRVLDNSGTPSGPGLLWSRRDLTYSFSTTGTQALGQNEAQAAVRAAFAVWQAGVPRPSEPGDCGAVAIGSLPKSSDVVFLEQPPSDQDYVGYNYLNPSTNRNMIFFRDSKWPYPLTAPTSDLLGTTTLTYNNITGEILDADIEFNTADYSFSTGDQNIAWDLMNTAVHEVGHFLGFADSKTEGAAMFGTTARGETTKRTLSCDDAAILWYRYPAGDKSGTCNTYRVDESCGFCAPPGLIQFTPTHKVQDAFDGRSGCNCRSHEGSYGFVLAAATLALRLGARRWRRR